jgi:hypothetical protein
MVGCFQTSDTATTTRKSVFWSDIQVSTQAATSKKYANCNLLYSKIYLHREIRSTAVYLEMKVQPRPAEQTWPGHVSENLARHMLHKQNVISMAAGSADLKYRRQGRHCRLR